MRSTSISRIGTTTYYSLAAGFLTGKYRTEADFHKSPRGASMKKFLNPRGQRILAALDDVARRCQATPAQVALAWLIAQPGVTASIASATSIAQLDELLGSARLTLDADAFAASTGQARRRETSPPDPHLHSRQAKSFSHRGALIMHRLIALSLLSFCCAARAEPIGEVDTVFKLIGPDHKIVVEAHDDPKVKGVTCYVSRAKTGGIKGALGVAEDRSEASIDCKQVGPITFNNPLPMQEDMFSERISLLFKRIHVVRMVDRARNTLVYLTYSDRVIEGSPQNSITVVAVDPSTSIPLR